MTPHDIDIQGDVDELTEDKVTEPPMYRVILHNDDFTTKEFVVHILVAVFHKSMEEANRIMWQTHDSGNGLCGIYPYDVAETKVKTTVGIARENGFPLRLTLEKD